MYALSVPARTALAASISLSFALCVSCASSSKPEPQTSSSAASSPANRSSEQTAPTDDGASTESTQANDQEQPVAVPTQCAEAGQQPCQMPRDFVKRLCAGAYPELALYFFSQPSPWSRLYVAVRQAEPFNGMGGPSSDQNLIFDEELLVLSKHTPDLQGMSVSGVGASYDVLRWDGTCATMQEAETRPTKPPSPKYAPVEWKRINDDIREALQKDSEVDKYVEQRRKECKGVTMGVVSDKCEKATIQLQKRIVQVVRNGIELPLPSRVPQ